MRQSFYLSIFLMMPALGVTQGTKLATEFPASATALSLEEAVKVFNGKSFSFTAADGFNLRVQLKDNGYCFINASPGGQTSGTWALKDSKLCTKLKGDPQESCSEVRRDAERTLLKRTSNGEIVELKFAP